MWRTWLLVVARRVMAMCALRTERLQRPPLRAGAARA
jgi:hypothetical protein